MANKCRELKRTLGAEGKGGGSSGKMAGEIRAGIRGNPGNPGVWPRFGSICPVLDLVSSPSFRFAGLVFLDFFWLNQSASAHLQ